MWGKTESYIRGEKNARQKSRILTWQLERQKKVWQNRRWQQSHAGSNKERGIGVWANRHPGCRAWEATVPLPSSDLLRPPLEFCVQFWPHHPSGTLTDCSGLRGRPSMRGRVWKPNLAQTG